ncbi:MAG: hypothetical protein WBD98_04620 [Acidobacteriaceae bacterium]
MFERSAQAIPDGCSSRPHCRAIHGPIARKGSRQLTLELRVERFGEEHIAPYVRLSRAEYGDHVAVAQESHLRWKFMENPQGPSVGIHLYKGEQLVGRLVAMPRDFLYRGRTYKAAYMADLVVEREHRGMLPLLQLMQGMKQLSGFDFIAVTPNPAGAEVWEKFARMPAHFDLAVAALPLRPARVADTSGKLKIGRLAPLVDWPVNALIGWGGGLGSLFAHGELETRWPDANELDSLFAAAAGEDQATGRRDSAFLEWRFRRSPVFRYSTMFLRDRGKLAGYVVTRRSEYGGYECNFVVDAFARPDLTAGLWREIRFNTIRESAKEGVEIAMAIGNLRCGALAKLAHFPFLAIPARYLPRVMKLYAQWLTAPDFSFQPEAFILSLGDCDIV